MSPDIYYNIAWVLNDENEIFYVMNEIFCVEWKILSTTMFRGEKTGRVYKVYHKKHCFIPELYLGYIYLPRVILFD